MSSRGFAVIRLELPAWTVASRAAAAVTVCAAGLAALTAASDLQSGICLAAAAASLTGMALRVLKFGPGNAVRRVELLAEGYWSVTLNDGRITSARTDRSCRVLGSTVVLALSGDAGRRRVWLTPADVPPGDLRRLAAYLLATGHGIRS